MPAEQIGDDDAGFTTAGDRRDLVEREGSLIDRAARAQGVVDEDIDGRRQ